MAETVIAAIDVGLQLFSIAQQVTQDIATWKLTNNILPEKLQSFSKSLKLVDTHLGLFRQSLEKVEGVPASQFQRSSVLFKVQNCIDKLNELSTVISNLENRATSSKVLKPIVTELDKVTPKYEQLLTDIDELSNDIEAISTIHVKTPVWAPAISPDYYFDLHSDNQDNPVTKVLDNILRPENHPIGAVVVGSGGMGKTTAACRIARDVKIKMQFEDGILFTALGDESSETDIIAKVASLVQCIDRQDVFQEIRDAPSIDEAVMKASLAFKGKNCMIIFDDVWAERIKSVDFVVALSKLVTCDSTKVIFTTRDTKYLGHPLTSKVAVFLDKRGRDESERMLVKSAGLEKPLFEEGLNVFNSILDDADGMPLALSLAGNTIKQISLDREENTKQYSWSDYGGRTTETSGRQRANTDILQQMLERIMKSISFMKLETGNDKYIDYFRALSVVQKAERMPSNVLCRAFDESSSAAKEILKTFKKYGIVGMKRGEETASEYFVTIHDLVIDCARSLVDSSDAMRDLLMEWLFSFLDQDIDKDSEIEVPRVADRFKEWWPEIEDDEDNYVYRSVLRTLKGACMFEEMVWLINEPWWIAKQIRVNGLRQIRIDLDMSAQCVSNVAAMEQSEREIMRQWIRLLNATITTSYEYVNGCKWDGMIYMQLYGRLQYYTEVGSVVEKFLQKIEESAPRPFVLPRLGSFPPASSQLLTKIKYNGDILSCKQINESICTVYISREGSRQKYIGIEGERIEVEHRFILILQAYDLKTGSITEEEIMRTSYELGSASGVLSNSGNIIFVGTGEGSIILVEKKLNSEEEKVNPRRKLK